MRRILFISGTRADFGKLKPLIAIASKTDEFDCHIFVTGMHLLDKYGQTIKEIYKSGFTNVTSYINQIEGDCMEMILSSTISGLSKYLHENKFNLIVVHGDRVEALAGAIVGALRNILVAHIEGGEVTGTIDELMRHAITKMSHIHFVTNELARTRLIQLGELSSSVFLIGSPDIDVMLSSNLPSLEEAKLHYEILFSNYAIAMLHPVTTELDKQQRHAQVFVDTLLDSSDNYIVIYPNNDEGSEKIFSEYERLKNIDRVKIYPSLRFEYFLVLLKNSDYIIGNSSAGIHEAPIYSVPTVNIGTRQHNRMIHSSIFNCEFNQYSLMKILISINCNDKKYISSKHYGNGTSAIKFIHALKNNIWDISNQKYFNDIDFKND